MDDFEAAFSQVPSEDTNGQAGDGNQESDAGTEVTPELQSQQEAQAQTDTTATTEAEAKATEAGKQGVFPKELEPYKGILESRKWDPSKPDFAQNVLKSYQEAESYAKRRETENNLLKSKADQFAAVIRKDLDSINQFRKQQGLPPFQSVRPVEERHKEVTSLIESVNRVLTNPEDAEAMRALDGILSKQRNDLEYELRKAQDTPPPSADAAFETRKSQSNSIFAAEVARNPEVAAHVDELSPYFQPGGLFDSFGLDVLHVAQSPAHLKAFAEIGQALHISRNLEKIVSDRVNAELDRRRTAGNSVGAGNQPKGNAKTSQASELSPVEMAFM